MLLPQGADPFLNTEAGSTGGVAIAIAPDELSVARVRRALERVLADDDFRTAAQRAHAEISAMPVPLISHRTEAGAPRPAHPRELRELLRLRRRPDLVGTTLTACRWTQPR